MKTHFITKLFRFNIALVFIEGMFVLWQYIKIPSESDVAVFLGFSLLRLIILFGVLFALLAIGTLFVSSLRMMGWQQKWRGAVTRIFERTEFFWFLFLAFGSIYIFLFSSEHYLGSLALHRTRLTPILVWAMLVTFQGLVSFLCIRAYDVPILEKYRDVFLPSVVAFVLLGFLILFIAFTRIGLTPDAVYWQDAGVPILLPQVWIAWLAGILFFYLQRRFNVFSSRKIDLVVSLGLWMVACAVWLNQPLAPAYNALEPKAPNFQMYPFGDALLYDVMAHGYLIGKPIPSDFWVKPLYSLFLSFLHLFAKDNFGVLVSLQVVILASIPVFVYLLTSELGKRPAGLAAGILVILRERNGIALSNVIEVSHSKLLMSDVFTMGLMVLLLWLLIKWIKKPDAYRSLPFVMGGLIAFLTLTRGHPIALLPVIGCIFLFMLPRNSFRWRSVFLLLLGFVLPIIPWLWRNYEVMGKLAFQNPISAYSVQVAGLYSMTPSLVPAPQVLSETDPAYYERLQKQVIEFTIKHPAELIKFVSAHYAHNAIFSYIYLPHSFEIDSLRAYIRTEEFWNGWKGNLNTHNRILLFLNIGVIALGMGGVWKDIKWYTFIPLLIGIGYNLSVSIGRLSGWRFILPADWITLIYYSIGLMQIAYIVSDLVTVRWYDEKGEQETRVHDRGTHPAFVIVVGVLFLGIGILLTYGQKLFVQPETIQTQAQMIQTFQKNVDASGSSYSSNIEKFLGNKNAIIVHGQALYPAFFKADSGVLSLYWRSFENKPFARLIFYLIGPQSAGVVLPMESNPPSFPDGADVIVVGCKTETGDIEALSIVITNADPLVFYNREPLPQLTCPFPESK